MPPIPTGVGEDFLRVIHQVDQQCEILAGLYLIETWQVRAAIKHLHRTTELYLGDIVADGGHHELHQLLWKIREGGISLSEWKDV